MQEKSKSSTVKQPLIISLPTISSISQPRDNMRLKGNLIFGVLKNYEYR